MPSKRKRINQDVEARVLMRSARRCCLCFHLDNDLREKPGQIAHLDRDPSNGSEENLAYLCMPHHSLYDSKTSQHKNYTIQEVKAYRSKLYDKVKKRKPCKWLLVLDGEFTELEKARIQRLVEHLRIDLRDSHLTIERIEPGSVRLLIESSERAFAILKKKLEAGELERFVGFPIQAVHRRLPGGEIETLQPAAIHNPGDVRSAVEPLIAALQNKEAPVREIVVWTLGRIADVHVVDPLIESLRDENPEVRRGAASALVKIGEPAVESLIEALEEPDVRDMAVKALRIIGRSAVEPLIAALQNKEAPVRVGAAMALAEIADTRAVEPLIAALQNDAAGSYAIAFALGKIADARAVGSLLAALQNEDSVLRAGAAEALGRISDPRALDSLITSLHDEDVYVRANSSTALGCLSDARVVEPLIAALRDQKPYVRSAAAEALGTIGRHSVEPLIVALQNENLQVRAEAVTALRKIVDARAVEPLIACLNDQDQDVRASAATALGRIGDVRAMKPLVLALRDDSPSVRQAAAAAIDQIKGPVPPPTDSKTGSRRFGT